MSLEYNNFAMRDEHRIDDQQMRRRAPTQPNHDIHICFNWPKPASLDLLLEYRIKQYMNTIISSIQRNPTLTQEDKCTKEREIHTWLNNRASSYTTSSLTEDSS